MRSVLYFGISLIVITVFSFEVLRKENEKKEYHFNWDGIHQEIRDTILVIDKFDTYDSRFSGYYGEESMQYLRIKWLKAHIINSEAELLLNYPSTLIQAIIFDKMLSRQHPMVIDFYKNHQHDTSLLYLSGGCESLPWKLNDHLKNSIQMEWHFHGGDSGFFKEFGILALESN